jgi:hypothetical protein
MTGSEDGVTTARCRRASNRAVRFEGLLNDTAHVEQLTLQLDLALTNSRHVQEFFEDAREMLCLPPHDAAHPHGIG